MHSRLYPTSVSSHQGARERKARIKQEGGMKTPKKEKDAGLEEAESKRRKPGETHEVNTPQRETRANARRRKTSSVGVTAGAPMSKNENILPSGEK